MHNDAIVDYTERPLVTAREVFATIRKYRGFIAMSVLAVAILALTASAAALLFLPSRRTTSLPFRLEFKGADRGEYPNGTKFSTSEVLSTPILLRVHKSNDLASMVDYSDFKSSIFITERNAALEALQREYRAKLSDPKLAVVDRNRLEEEFQQKKASLPRSEFMITYVDTGRIRKIPYSVKAKVLNDILDTWAEQTVQNKGVVLHDLPILTSGIFDRQTLATYDYVIALDILRANINRIIRNIDQLSEIPGAEVVRSNAPGNASLAELRVRLQDAVKFKVEPLVGSILASGLSKDPQTTRTFLETRLKFNEIERRGAETRIDMIRQALAAYQNRPGTGDAQAQNPDSAVPVTPTTVIPQINESFLERIAEFAGQSDDQAYRQNLIDEMRVESFAAVPMQAEEQYYRLLINALEGFEGRARAARPEELQSLQAQTRDVLTEAIQATDEVNFIYRGISQNLNPSTVLYSKTGPTMNEVERSLALPRLGLAVLLAILTTFILATIGSLVYSRFDTRQAETTEIMSEPAHPPVIVEPRVGSRTS